MTTEKKEDIPEQLRQDNFKFVLLGHYKKWFDTKEKKSVDLSYIPYEEIDKKRYKPEGKMPFEKEWEKRGYSNFSFRLKEHLENGLNVGIIAGQGNLRILDIDNPELIDEFESKINTFTIKTGSGGRHFYFISDYNTNHVLINRGGELRANNYQVVCPPSIHPNGNKYEIINDSPIATISKEDLFNLISPYIKQENIKTEKKEKEIKEKPESNITYSKEYLDKNIIPKLDTNTSNLIFNPKPEEYSSRSERDEAIITRLLLNGFGDYIKAIFDCYPCGDKYKEHSNPEQYLQKSIDKARAFSGVQDDKTPELENELNKLSEKVLKNKLDEYLLRISEVEGELMQKFFLGLIATKTLISKKELSDRLKKLKKGTERKQPVTASSVLNKDLPQVKYYIEPIIPKGTTICIGGKAGKGKSLMAQGLCISCSLKRDFLNHFKVDSNSKILLYDLENGEHTLHYRLKYLLNGLNAKSEELKDFEIAYGFDKDNLDGEIQLSKKYDIIILDSYRRFLQGTENDSEITDKFFSEYLRPLKELGKTIIILHHFKKSNPEEFNDDILMDLFRGSSDIPAQFDLILGLFKSSERQDKNYNLSYNLHIAKIKNRLGLPIKDFIIKVTKDDIHQKTEMDFVGYDKLKTQKEQILDRIIELLTLRDELRREEIIRTILQEFDCGKYNTSKYLTELCKEKIISRTKLGVYVLADKVISISGGDDQSTLI